MHYVDKSHTLYESWRKRKDDVAWLKYFATTVDKEMSEDAEIELAIQRLEELFPYPKDDTGDRDLCLMLVPRGQSSNAFMERGPVQIQISPLNDLPNAFRIISSYLRFNLFHDQDFREDVITAVIQKEGIKEVRKRARILEILGEYEDWEVNEDNIVEIINPGQFRKSRKMRAFYKSADFPSALSRERKSRTGVTSPSSNGLLSPQWRTTNGKSQN